MPRLAPTTPTSLLAFLHRHVVSAIGERNRTLPPVTSTRVLQSRRQQASANARCTERNFTENQLDSIVQAWINMCTDLLTEQLRLRTRPAKCHWPAGSYCNQAVMETTKASVTPGDSNSVGCCNTQRIGTARVNCVHTATTNAVSLLCQLPPTCKQNKTANA